VRGRLPNSLLSVTCGVDGVAGLIEQGELVEQVILGSRLPGEGEDLGGACRKNLERG
jgi:hypothetical protein